MKYFIPFIIILYGSIQTLHAQQYPLFTNYVINCFGFNPAVAGTTDYVDLKLTYRAQWVGQNDAPRTQIISGHGKLKKLPIGIGAYAFNDVAGALTRTGGTAVLSYSQPIGQSFLCVGLSGGFYNMRLKKDFTIDNANDPLVVNGMTNLGTPDFNAGLYLHNPKGWFVGLSVPQVWERKLDFLGNNNDNQTKLERHYYLMGGYNIQLNENIQLQPSALIKYVSDAPFQYDISAVATFYNKLWLGGSYRSAKDISLMAGMNVNHKLNLAYAYDLTTSGLNDFNSGSHEITLGFRLGKEKDTDEDGIPDKDDKCPEEPGTIENEGCPEEPATEEEEDEFGDRDKDGIINKDDKCPDEAGPEENLGCPWGDTDGDGIRDDIDKCPNVSGLASNEGCPLTDRDNDGVVDNKDKCPDIAGAISNEGCPKTLETGQDRDRDGILDADDRCPDIPGIRAKDGCPGVDPADQRILDLAIQNVYFDTNSDEIRPEGFPYLNRLAQLMIEKRDLKIRLSGHADARGTSAYNLDLSKRRAQSVMFYLLNHGLRRTQLTIEYYGEEAPAAPNETESTRRVNRRVEMEFVWE